MGALCVHLTEQRGRLSFTWVGMAKNKCFNTTLTGFWEGTYVLTTLSSVPRRRASQLVSKGTKGGLALGGVSQFLGTPISDRS